MAEKYNVKILYTPLVPYLVEFENNSDSYLDHLHPIKTDFSHNHIPYLKEQSFTEKLVYDTIGVNRTIDQVNDSVRYMNT